LSLSSSWSSSPSSLSFLSSSLLSSQLWMYLSRSKVTNHKKKFQVGLQNHTRTWIKKKKSAVFAFL
jgi:hypothetical protein